MASEADILKEGFNLKRRLDAGGASAEDLNDRGRILLSVVRRQRRLEDLNPEGRRLLELPEAFGAGQARLGRRALQGFERLKRGYQEVPEGGPAEIGGLEVLGRAARFAKEGAWQTLTDPEGSAIARLRRRFPGPPGIPDPLAMGEALERGLMYPFSAILEGAAGLAPDEKTREFVRSMVGLGILRAPVPGFPAGVPRGRAGAARFALERALPPEPPRGGGAVLRPEARPSVTGEPAGGGPGQDFVWDPEGQTFRSTRLQPQRALPPGPPMPDWTLAPPRGLPGRVGPQRALPPGPRELERRPFREEAPTVIPEPPAQGELLDRPVVLDAAGRPVKAPPPTMTERERLRILHRRPLGEERPAAPEPPPTPPPPPAAPEPPPPRARPAEPPVEAPGLPAPRPELPPAAPTAIRWKERPAGPRRLAAYRSEDGRFLVEQTAPDVWRVQDNKARGQIVRFSTFQEARQWAAQRQQVPPAPPKARPGRVVEGTNANTVNVDNPAQVARYVRGYRGVKVPEDLKGEFRDISSRLKNQKGKALDELAQEIADAQGLNAHDVQNRIVTSLRRFSRGEREATPPVPRGMMAEAERPTPPEDIIRQWQQMDAEGRQATIGALRPGGREPGEGAAPVPEPPTPPAPRGEPTTRFEPTPEGMQGVLPVRPGQEMPPTPLRGAERPFGETPLGGATGELRQERIPGAEGRRPFPWEREAPREPPVKAGSATEVRAPQPPADVPVPSGEWETMTPKQRQAAIDFFRERGQARTGLLPPLALGAAGAAALARPGGDQPEEPPQPGRGRLRTILEAAAATLPMLAMLGSRGRVRPPGAGPVRRLTEPPGRPPEVPPQYRRERIMPEPEILARAERGERRPPSEGPGVPPNLRGGSPLESAVPEPLPGVPASHVDGSAHRGMPEPLKYFVQTMLGRYESMGPAGQEISRRIQRVGNDTATFWGRNVWPIVQDARRLSKAEADNFRRVADLGETPMNDRVQQVYQRYLTVFGPEGVIPREATKRNLMVKLHGGERRAFEPRQQFFPHEFDPAFVRDVLRAGSKTHERAVQQLLDRGQVRSRAEAEIMLDDFFGGRIVRGQRPSQSGVMFQIEPERFVGGLERGREINIDGYLLDPAQAIGIRGWKAARRFAEIDHYGYFDSEILGSRGHLQERPLDVRGQPHRRPPRAGLIDQIQEQAGLQPAMTARQLWHTITGRDPTQQVIQDWVRRLNNFEVFTKLPLAFIVNATQPTLTAVRTNIATTARGFGRLLAHPVEGVRYAREMGVLADMSMRQLWTELAGTPTPNRAVEWVLKPFTMAEKLNRVVTVNAGRYWGQRLDRALQRPATRQNRAWLERELGNLNFSTDEVAHRLQAGRLLEGDMERVAWTLTDQTQFLNRWPRRSEFLTTPLGQVMGLYKSFGINAGRVIKQAVIDEARAGNYAPLARMVVLFPIIGEVAADARALMRGSERPDTLIGRLLDDFTTVAGFGLATDFVQSVGKMGWQGAASFLMGPFLSDAAQAANRSWKLAEASYDYMQEGDWLMVERQLRESGRFALRNVPFAGPALAQAMRTDPRGEKQARRTWQEQLKIDPGGRQMRALEALDRRAGLVLREADKRAAGGDVEGAQAMLDGFNRRHGTALRLSLSGIRRIQRRQQPGAPPQVRPGLRPLLQPVGEEE